MPDAGVGVVQANVHTAWCLQPQSVNLHTETVHCEHNEGNSSESLHCAGADWTGAVPFPFGLRGSAFSSVWLKHIYK